MAKEFLPENEEPLNQLSKKALSGLKVKPDSSSLYLVQLMLWVLRERRDQFNRDNWPDLVDAAEYLERQKPKVVLKMLYSEDELGDQLFQVSKDLKDLDPEGINGCWPLAVSLLGKNIV